MKSLKLEIGGIIALTLGLWALASCWWFVVEIIIGLLALSLLVGGAITIAIALRRRYRVNGHSESSEPASETGSDGE